MKSLAIISAIAVLSILSSPAMSESTKYVISHAEKIRTLVKANLLEPSQQSAYQQALIRQSSKNIDNRLCVIKINKNSDTTLFSSKKAAVCQFLTWHNLNIARGIITDDRGSRFSSFYFYHYINTQL